ncbi:hypothetical protein [Saccharopolyspora hattusasensis]|uniref:hypothetical protein n=1 Tax=Saccharopolyspora hattusasensis TaxID=1128679 RepID=UPI003D99EC3F
MAAAARVVELEELEGRDQLTDGQAKELAALRPKAQRWQKLKELNAKYYQAGKVAADRVAELEEREQLTDKQATELAALRPKAQQWQKQKERVANRYRAVKAVAVRVAELEELGERDQLTEGQAVELAALRPKVAGRGRKKKVGEVSGTGVGSGAPVVGQGVGPEGVAGWTGTEQDGRDAWSAEVDLDAWLDWAVADVDGVWVPQGAVDAGVMLGEDAYEEFVATELLAFLNQDAGDDAAAAQDAGPVAGDDDFAAFLDEYGEDPLGLFGVEGEGLVFGGLVVEGEGEVLPGRVEGGGLVAGAGVRGVWGRVVGGERVGSWSRFLRGVNQANYFSGDKRFRVNCLEACVAFHRSRELGRQFVAGPAGDRDPAWLVEALGGKARWVAGVAGAARYVRSVRVGGDVPVIFQRRDGSAHAVNAVHVGQGVVAVVDAQKGEEDASADVVAATGVWVVELPEAGPAAGSGLRREDRGAGLPTEVTGPKRQPRGGPVAGGAAAKGTKRTREEGADQGSRGEAGEGSGGVKRRKVLEPVAGAGSGSHGGEGDGSAPTGQAAQQEDPRTAAQKAGTKRTKSARGAKRTRGEGAEQGSRAEAGEGSRAPKRRKADAAAAVGAGSGSPGDGGRGVLTPRDQAAPQDPSAEKKRKKKEKNAKQYQARKAAAARVAELEALKGQGPLTPDEEKELAKLQPKVAQQKQKKKEFSANYRRVGKAAADRVAVLEGLARPLTEGQAAELAALQPKAQTWQKQKESSANRYWAGKAAADRVAELEELEEREQLTDEQEKELTALRPKAQRWQKQKERVAERYWAVKAAADRVAELEELEEREQLTDGQAGELAALRSKVAGRGQKKKVREVTGTGVDSGAPVGRGVGSEGVSGWVGAERDGRDGWSAEVDLDAWLAGAVADVDGVWVPQGAADAGVMLGEDAYEEFVATELLAFLNQDAGDDAAAADDAGLVAGDDDFAAFLDEYGEDPLGLFGVEGEGLVFGGLVVEGEGEALPGRVEGGGLVAGAGVRGVWGRVVGGERVGSWSRFLRGVNQANYFSGDKRFRVNCLEACVAFHQSRELGRQFVAGPAGDRDPAWLVEALGGKARWVAGVAGAARYVRSVRVGGDVPVIFQRRDGSAHAVNAVHVGQGVVAVVDAQKGEEDASADVVAATGVWVVELPEAGPAAGSGLRREDRGAGLPTEVTGPKRQPRGGPVAGGAAAKGTKRTREEGADQGSRGEAGERSSAGAFKRRKVPEPVAGAGSGSHGGEGDGSAPTGQAAQQEDPRTAPQKAGTKRTKGARGAKRTRGEGAEQGSRAEAGEGSRAPKRRKADAAAAVGAVSGSPGDGGSEVLTPRDQAAPQDPSAEKKRKRKEQDAKRYQTRKAAAARVVELEALKEKGPLTPDEEKELAKLQPKAQQWQKRKEDNAKYRRLVKAAAARVTELEELKEREQLTDEQEKELAELQQKAQQWQKQKERFAVWYRVGKAAADRVAELEEREQLTEGQAAELAALRPKVAQRKQKKKESAAKYRRVGKAAADRVAELEELEGREQLTDEQEKELAALRPKAQQWQKQKERFAVWYRVGKAAADRVAELEELEGREQLTDEQEKELAALRPKAQQWQKYKERVAERYRAVKAAADRVAELEEREQLTEGQAAELAALRPKVAQRKQKKKESAAKYRRVGKAAADRVAELEELEGREQLTDEQAAELAALRPKAQQWQKHKKEVADWYRVGKAAADRVAELEELEGREQLTDEQEKELAALRPKAQQWQKHKKEVADWYRAVKAAADRVAELEELEGREQLTDEQEKELAALRPKAQQWQKQKERVAERYRAVKAAADRVAELEELGEREQLTDGQAKELAALRSKLAGRGRKKKVAEVSGTGVGSGAPVVGQGVGPVGVSGWTGTERYGRDGWSAEVDLDAWLAGAVADVDGVWVPQGAADVGVMLGEDAYEEFVATELLAFLNQDAGDDAVGAEDAGPVAGDDDFAAFLNEYGEDSLGLFGVEGEEGLVFGGPLVVVDVDGDVLRGQG